MLTMALIVCIDVRIDDNVRHFADRSISAWTSYFDRTAHFSGERTARLIMNGRVLNSNTQVYRFGDSNSMDYKSVTNYYDRNGNKRIEEIYVYNSSYGFVLSSRDESKLTLDSLDHISNAKFPMLDKNFDPRVRIKQVIRTNVYSLPNANANIRDIATNYQEIDKEIKTMPNGLIQVQTKLNLIADKTAIEKPILRYKVTLNPGRHWRIEAYEFDRKWNSTVTEYCSGIIEYTELSNDICMPKHYEHSFYYSNDASKVAKLVTDMSYSSEPLLPESEFTMTRYGFQEPQWLISNKSKSQPWSLYVSIAGVLCLLIATGIYYYRGKGVSA